mmetsp:Transcript_9488/g.31707  ORF Transcript_9488/g.31707 Transcript_9488/m.31707 type:complete len:280 (-) Transcript_9488:743-1582(-)
MLLKISFTTSSDTGSWRICTAASRSSTEMRRSRSTSILSNPSLGCFPLSQSSCLRILKPRLYSSEMLHQIEKTEEASLHCTSLSILKHTLPFDDLSLTLQQLRVFLQRIIDEGNESTRVIHKQCRSFERHVCHLVDEEEQEDQQRKKPDRDVTPVIAYKHKSVCKEQKADRCDHPRAADDVFEAMARLVQLKIIQRAPQVLCPSLKKRGRHSVRQQRHVMLSTPSFDDGDSSDAGEVLKLLKLPVAQDFSLREELGEVVGFRWRHARVISRRPSSRRLV